MGIVLSWLEYDVDRGETDDPDPITGLTSRDKYLIRTTWEAIMSDPASNGVKLFMKWFEIQPKYQKPFSFKNVPMKDLPQDSKFQSHCSFIIYSFAALVCVLDDNELLFSIIEKLGFSHAGISVDKQALEDMKQAFISIFNSLTEEETNAWNKLLSQTFEQMNAVVQLKKQRG